MPKLKPPKNERPVRAPSCATCKWLDGTEDHDEGSYGRCIRPDGPVFYGGEIDAWTYVCDRYKMG